MKKILGKAYSIVFSEVTMILLFCVSLLVSIILFFCNLDSSGNFLAASAAFIAAAVTLQVAKSANNTSSQAHKIALHSIEMDIIEEGPVLRIDDIELILSGQSQNRLTIKNYGNSPAINLSCELFEISNLGPVFKYSTELGRPTNEFSTTVEFNLLPGENMTKEFVLLYENFGGRKFENRFSIKERNVHEGNAVVPGRTSGYRVMQQKNNLIRDYEI